MENFTSLVEVCFSLSQTHPYLEAAACSLSSSIQADGPARARGRRGKLTQCSSSMFIASSGSGAFYLIIWEKKAGDRPLPMAYKAADNKLMRSAWLWLSLCS